MVPLLLSLWRLKLKRLLSALLAFEPDFAAAEKLLDSRDGRKAEMNRIGTKSVDQAGRKRRICENSERKEEKTQESSQMDFYALNVMTPNSKADIAASCIASFAEKSQDSSPGRPAAGEA